MILHAGTDLNLINLQIELLNEDHDVSYEPEVFPGLILRMHDATFNIYANGKFLILGCSSPESVERSEKEFLELIECINSRY